MDRRFHNHLKKVFIQRFVTSGDKVLDAGCGFGGDFNKWMIVGASFIGVDPSYESLEEARNRFPDASLLHGTLLDVPRTLRFNVICFNFSLQYCKPNLSETFKRAHELLGPFGIIIGIVPDGDRIGDDPCYTINPDGESVTVFIPGTPYYETKGPVSEPLITKTDVIRAARPYFDCGEWSHFNKVYSKFVLIKKE